MVIIAALVVMPAVSADRLPGKDVKALLERIHDERDRFEDQLDGKIKSSIIRGEGEVHVGRFLDDLQENVDRLNERFTYDYAASAEVTTVLRQGTDIQRFMSKQPPDLDGASEWNRLASSFGELAKAYATTFPLPAGEQARRASDKEVKDVASELEKSADQFKKDLESALKTNTTIDQPTKDAAVKEVNSLKEDAETLASTVGDGRPASGEAKAVLDRAAKIRGAAASSGRALSPAAQTAWGPVESWLTESGGGVRPALAAPVSADRFAATQPPRAELDPSRTATAASKDPGRSAEKFQLPYSNADGRRAHAPPFPVIPSTSFT